MNPTTNPPRATLMQRLVRNPLLPIAVVFLGAVAYMQWPMIKGRFYGDAAPPDGIGWRTDFAAALTEARQTGKPLLVDFSATWCPPCKVMKHEVWPDSQVGAAVAARYIPVLVNPDLPENREVLRRYEVSGFPTVMLVDDSGNVIRQAHFLTRDAMLKFLGSPG